MEKKYIIHKTNFTVLEVENPNEAHQNGFFTNLEFVLTSINENVRANYLVLDTLPIFDKKYWTLENEQIVEMSEAEKNEVDTLILAQIQQQESQREKEALRQDAFFGSELSAKFMLEFNFTSVEQSVAMDDKLVDVNRNLVQGMLMTAMYRLQEVTTDELFTEAIKAKYIGILLNYLNK